MKNNLLGRLALIALLAIVSTACNKNNDGITPQTHDANVYQQIMHANMTQMNAMKMTGDPDHDFAMMMSMHHQGAIDMANEVLKSGNDPMIKTMAQNVVSSQTSEKSQFTQFLSSHQAVASDAGKTFDAMAMQGMDKMMKAQDTRFLSGNSDVDFTALMIDHHQSALDMAQMELNYGKVDSMKQMAQKIIEEQKTEISQFQDWLIKNKPY
ncbi:hypothetical protein GCM10028818_53330 [Spirosoma horti]|uniref:DUF305 domain-containing protein n=1 Tax=Spirosoma pollinicola TaxID=2057025 RepID=A0A2K8Z6A6_9BACT|nr:DUF305 domain-containing protein [Spirosoma pollinicola]AUD05426.1 DUF305 domain-containing protein [Spirosoma pollinicola]RYF78544.1 MAG: DUF305 domain-containing protein [Cytophagaceae bacterium]